MDSIEVNVIFRGGVPFHVGDKAYMIKALPIADIITEDFAKCGLYFPADDEPVSNWQAVNLTNEAYRQTLDKWLCYLLSLNGKACGLEDIARDMWTDEDIGRFLLTTLKASGMSKKEKKAEQPTEPDVWLDILSEYQYHLHRSWNEVTAMPLLQLNALREKVLQYAANDSRGLFNGLMGGGNADGTPNSNIRAGYDAFFNDCRGNNPPTFKTRQEYEAYQAQQNKGMAIPQFKSRDEYFAWANSHR